MMRSSAVSLALGYVAWGWSALVLFAAPLWYAWQAPFATAAPKSCRPTRSAHRHLSARRRRGVEELHRCARTHADRRRPHFAADRCRDAAAGRQSSRVARTCPRPRATTRSGGRGRARPADRPGACATLLGGYNLLVGRDNRLFAPLQTRFWYGLTGGVAVLSIAGLLIVGSSRAAL
jgi:hypothetical protein